jgi:hypothetical protein
MSSGPTIHIFPDAMDGVEEPDEALRFLLAAAEQDTLLVSMAQERAGCGEWLPELHPRTAADYLTWALDEALVQVEQALQEMREEAANPQHTYDRDRLPYAMRLLHWAGKLAECGVYPALLPWEKVAVDEELAARQVAYSEQIIEEAAAEDEYRWASLAAESVAMAEAEARDYAEWQDGEDAAAYMDGGPEGE